MTDTETTAIDLVLSELRALRDDLIDYTRSSGERLATLETGMYDLRGNGQPGRVSRLEAVVADLDKWKTRILGIAAGVSTMVSVLAWVVVELVVKKDL